MLKMKHGVDILAEVGGVKTVDDARKIIAENLDAENQAKLAKIKTEDALVKIANAIAHCKPDRVVICTGSEEDKAAMRQDSLDCGAEEKLAMDGHTIHFDLPEEQGRIVDRTFYIVNEGEEISVLAKKMLRDEALEYVRTNMDGIMKGKTCTSGSSAAARPAPSWRSPPSRCRRPPTSCTRRPALPPCLRELRRAGRRSPACS
jgi:phosphoenolpyruvate carboxykinase (GTP)